MNTYINPEAIENKSITKDKLSDDLIFDIKGEIPNNEIWYTTGSYNKPSVFSCTHPDFISHTWENDKWVVRFSKPIVELNNIFFGYDPDAGESNENEEGVQWVPDYENISLITFPNSLKSITECIFDGEYGNACKVVLSDKMEQLYDNWAGDPTWGPPATGVDEIEIGGPIISTNDSSAPLWAKNVYRIIVKDGTKRIGNYKFAELPITTDIILPNSVTEIGLAAFYKATELKNVQLGDSVKTIGNSAFNYTAINTLELPATVTSLGSTFVRNCTNLKKITVNSVVSPTISANSFPNPNQYKYTIIVPDESLLKYKKATNWSLYSSYIHSINEEMTSITYDDLKTLQSAGNLRPGHQYRIIDYYTYTIQPGTHAEGNAFDVIVTALTNTTFSEEAKALQSGSDLVGYFTNSKLSAWKLWYCFANDTNRFAWASTSGRGVIYRMIDEFGNDCPYDFKNIKFDKYHLCVNKFIRKSDNKVFKYFGTTLSSPNTGAKRLYCYVEENTMENISGSTINNVSVEHRLFFNKPLEPKEYSDLYTVSADDIQIAAEYECSWNMENSEDYWSIEDIRDYNEPIELDKNSVIIAYTFNLRTSGQVLGSFDYSIHRNNGKCFRNVIKSKFDENNDGKMFIPCVIFDNTSYGSCYKNEIEAPITTKNGELCRLIFGNHNHNNTLGRGCFNIFTYESCFDNRFDTGSNNLILLDKCTTNTFGTHTSNIIMLGECTGNIFDAYCDNKELNTKTVLHKGCDFNKFGSYCYGLTLNESCSYNVFEGNNINIVMDTDSDYNWFAPYWRGRSISGDCKHYTNIDIKEYTYSQLIGLKNSDGLNPGAKYKLTDYVSDYSLCPILTALTSNSFDRKATAVDENGNSYDIEFNIDKISGKLTIDRNETGILLTGDQDPYAIDSDNENYGIIKTGSEDELGLVISPIISDSYSSLPLGDILKTKTEQMYVYAINTIAGDPYWSFATTDYNYSTITGNTDTGEGCLKLRIGQDAGSEHNLNAYFFDENDNLIKSYYTSDFYDYGEIVSFENIFGIDGLVLNAIIDEEDQDPEFYYVYSYELKYNNTVMYRDESSSLEVNPEDGYMHVFNIPNSMIFYALDDGNQSGGEEVSVYICSKTPLKSTSFKTFDQEFNICIKITHHNNDGEEFSYYVPIYKCINSYYDEDSDVSYYTEFSKEPARKISNVTSRIYLNSDESLKGTITYMKDKNGNIAPIDFINVTIDESPIFSDLQNSYNNQVEGVLETDDIWNYPYIRFEGRVRNNKISAGTSNILVKSSYNFVGNGISNQVINSNGMTILNGLTYIE